MSRTADFKKKLRSAAPLLGTWIKTPSRIVTEVLAGSTLDVLCLDAEHAPFDRSALDGCILACRALDMPVLVRVPTGDPHHILDALDLGANGVVVPHVRLGEDARAAAAAAHYGPNGRGYAGSSRAANFTRRTMAEHIAASREATVVVAQVEDGEAVERIDEIVAVDAIDAVFIGTADLAVSLGSSIGPRDPVVVRAAEKVCEAARTRGRAVGIFVPAVANVAFWRERGVSLFLLGSDQVMLQSGAALLRTEADEQFGLGG